MNATGWSISSRNTAGAFRRRRRHPLGGLAALIVLLATAWAAPSAQALPYRSVCGTPAPNHMQCFAEVVTNGGAQPSASASAQGYGPADLVSAYNLPGPSTSNGTGQTIAIVDAFDDPNAESDLATYRSRFGLKPCTTANGCFSKVNEFGGTNYPAGDAGWGQEISLDLDMASAICPNCRILLVEGSTSTTDDLAAAVDRAAAMGATQISNSYGTPEYPGEVFDQSHYNHPGIDVTVSGGDDGYGVSYPAASQYVTSVGGTSLSRAGNARGWSESTWNKTGSGCSAYIAKPSWQSDAGCPRRTTDDVSAVGNPYTGVAVYDTFGSGGWLEFGGTSVGSPIIAGVDALAGGRAAGTRYGSYPYGNLGSFYDVIGGSDGSCGGSYLCTAVAGYDGPTGVGTPDGASPQPPPPGVSVSPQGNWVGTFGAGGYALLGWTPASDLTSLPNASLSLDQGTRFSWQTPTTDVRGLESPDLSTRAATTYYDPNEIRASLTFTAAYTGVLHVYAVDWRAVGRRETITVGGQSVALSGDFSQGAWVAFPISVAAGAVVPIVVDRVAGVNAVLSGIFLGEDVSRAPQGNWVGTFGAGGYALLGWTPTTDLVSLPNASVSLAQGTRFSWQTPTTDVRGLESPDLSTRAATTYYDPNEIRASLTFTAAYTGVLHVYAVDWRAVGRRETITVGGQSVALSGDFSQGAWVAFPISVAAGAVVPIVVDRVAGVNAVLSGIFLG